MRVRQFNLLVLVVLVVCRSVAAAADEPTSRALLDYQIDVTTVTKGYDGQTCWMQARAGAIPAGTRGNPSPTPIVVMTLQKLQADRSDVYYGLNDYRTDDLGATWIGPTPHATLERHRAEPDLEVVPCDFWPTWHAKTGKLLGTGATFWYSASKNDHVKHGPSETPYSVYDPQRKTWSEWRTLEMPADRKFEFSRAGCTQRVDLPNGDILLPIYFRRADEKHRRNRSTICRCQFDGETLRYVEHGDELTIDIDRGLYEPSLTKYVDRYFLTLRNDRRAYVTTSGDGLHFDEVRPWTFDDGSDLGSYNTQQHWATHSDGLYLVYTRRGANNDRVFRHRAPLFMARVDPEKLVVIRASEKVLLPDRGAAVGNFGVTTVSPDETWVIATECMMPGKPEQYGSDNSVYVVKLRWSLPNSLAPAPSALSDSNHCVEKGPN
ncbi:MAG: exo-alpha-sialidase [Pirellulales bacterium]